MSLYPFIIILPWLSSPLLLLSVIEVVRLLELQRNGLNAVGTVVDRDTDQEAVTPIVGFEDASGKARRLRVSITRSTENWSIGTTWPILYQKNSSGRAVVNKPLQRWGRAVFFLLIFLYALIVLWIIKICWLADL